MIAYLLHAGALGLLLAQMRRAQLHRGERSLFLFLAAWCAACFAALLLDHAASTFPAAYIALNLAPFLFAAPALARAGRNLAAVAPEISYEDGESAAVVIIWPFIALVVAALAGREVWVLWPGPEVSAHIAAFNAAAWVGMVAGATLLTASFCYDDAPSAEHRPVAEVLRRGVGAYLVTYHGGLLLAAALRADLAAAQALLVVAAVAALATAAFITPRPDVLINPEVLAVVPAGRLAATTTPSAVATYAGLDTAHHAPCAPPPPLTQCAPHRRNG